MLHTRSNQQSHFVVAVVFSLVYVYNCGHFLNVIKSSQKA